MSTTQSTADVSRSTEDTNTAPPSTDTHRDQSNLSEHGIDHWLRLEDFHLPEHGTQPDSCGFQKTAATNTFCPNGKGVRTDLASCKRLDCPDCGTRERLERIFKICFVIEAYARHNDERPHSMWASIPEDEASQMSLDDLKTSLFRRFYRRARDNMNAVGGYCLFHGARVKDDKMKSDLASAGFARQGAGHWRGIRGDVLDLGQWRDYARWSPHLHSVGFPSYLDQYDKNGSTMNMGKSGELSSLDDVVSKVTYLMSHITIHKTEKFDTSRAWGCLSPQSNDYFNPEDELTQSEFSELAQEVAEAVNDWNWSYEQYAEKGKEDVTDGILSDTELEDQTCPCCDDDHPVGDNIGLYDVTKKEITDSDVVNVQPADDSCRRCETYASRPSPKSDRLYTSVPEQIVTERRRSWSSTLDPEQADYIDWITEYEYDGEQVSISDIENIMREWEGQPADVDLDLTYPPSVLPVWNMFSSGSGDWHDLDQDLPFMPTPTTTGNLVLSYGDYKTRVLMDFHEHSDLIE